MTEPRQREEERKMERIRDRERNRIRRDEQQSIFILIPNAASNTKPTSVHD